MPFSVEAILFDVGGTLRRSLRSGEARRQAKIDQIRAMVDSPVPLDEFSALLATHATAYSRWAREYRAELREVELWTRWMLPDYPAARIGQMAIELNQLWREALGIREVLPQAGDILVQLFRRGYRLGIVSNTASSIEVPAILRDLQIGGLMETVILSCVVGVRKPDPGILLEATRRMEIEPGKCVYIGDRHDRDAIAAREAGFAKVVIVRGVDALVQSEPDAATPAADHYVDDLNELLEIFPGVERQPPPAVKYRASCSTMWARHNFPGLPDFFEQARRLGFAAVELNHQVDSSMLNGVPLERVPLSSVHEPCPADVSVEQLKERDWLISSPDELCRRHGVQAIQRSIDLAGQQGLPVVVVHCGMVSTEGQREQRLRALLHEGAQDTGEYRALKDELVGARCALIGPRLDAVRRSLQELLQHAARVNVCLGLENRYHYFDIPSLDEMGELLSLAEPARLGFVYDVGHAQALDKLGFYPHEEWLRRYSTRIVETHLHDVRGTDDHRAPGLCEMDFDMVGSYLPSSAIRTLELQPSNTPEQVRAGLRHLEQHGCITRMEQDRG